MHMNWIPWLSGALQSMTPQQTEGGGGMTQLLFMFGIIIFLYYFLLHAPQKRKQKEREQMLNALKKGDEVITMGGIYGKITGVTDTVVTLEVAPKVRIKVAKSQVSNPLSKSEPEKSDAKPS